MTKQTTAARAQATTSFHIFPAGQGYLFEGVDADGEPVVIGSPCATRSEAVMQVMKVAPFGNAPIHFSDKAPGGPAFAAIAEAIASGAAAH